MHLGSLQGVIMQKKIAPVKVVVLANALNQNDDLSHDRTSHVQPCHVLSLPPPPVYVIIDVSRSI
jgi:hypothetical protein